MALENVITSLVLDVIDHDQTQGIVKAIALDSKTRYVKATIVQHGVDYPVDENATITQLYPWGTAPTSEFITLAKTNGFELYDSITMSEGDLLNVESFSKGYTLREVNNVRMIRDTISYWADGLIT